MAIIQLFKSIFDIFRVTKEMANQYSRTIEDMSIVHKMECACEIENKFLSSMMAAAEKQITHTGFDDKKICDMADKLYQIEVSHSQIFGRGEKIDLLDIKKRMFVFDFIEIEEPILVDQSSQISADARYNQYLVKRQNKIEELKISINRSSALTKVFCAYLARSNYPKKNSFEILPSDMNHFFDSERKNSKHLKNVKILDSIVGVKRFNL